MTVGLCASRFTPPSPWCPHPEWWTAHDEDSAEVEVSEFLAGLVRVLQPRVCVETGSGSGQTAALIGGALARNGRGRLTSLETDPVRVAAARALCAGLPVDIVELSSLDYFPSGWVDFVLFDSRFALRVPEYRRLRPYMQPGAFVAFRDTVALHDSGGCRGGHVPADIGDVVFLEFQTPRGLLVGQIR